MKHLIIALTSLCLTPLCEKLLNLLEKQNVTSHLVIAKKYTKKHSHANYIYKDNDIAATIASGSFKTSGLIILGYSDSLMFEINSGITKSLIARAADVVLKEKRRLVYVVEKTPWDGNMVQQLMELTALGGIVFPLAPAFYNHPQSIEDVIHHAAARMMDLFGITVKTKRWE